MVSRSNPPALRLKEKALDLDLDGGLVSLSSPIRHQRANLLVVRNAPGQVFVPGMACLGRIHCRSSVDFEVNA